jgi:thiosulfate reductase cytochrome b subunit
MPVGPGEATSRRVLVKRHSIAVRVTHWFNVLCLAVLLASGLQIFNAHPALYWGDISTFDDPWLMTGARQEADGSLRGVTRISGHEFTTTGFLGVSTGITGAPAVRGFPQWLTLPSYQDLATGRRWHFFFAWFFVLNGAAYLLYTLLSGHAWRDLIPTRHQLATLGRSIWDHMRLRFPEGEEARVYNGLQKLTYLPVVFILLPLMVLTGLAMSPGFNAVLPEIVTVFGGRQSARTIHFIVAFLLVVFVFVHVLMVVLSGLWNNMRSMVTGRYAIDTGKDDHA